jgi:hypothetical protein
MWDYIETEGNLEASLSVPPGYLRNQGETIEDKRTVI